MGASMQCSPVYISISLICFSPHLTPPAIIPTSPSHSLHLARSISDSQTLTLIPIAGMHRRAPAIASSKLAAPPSSTSSSSSSAAGKKRGSYNCGRCGLPKKGHVCQVSCPDPTDPAPIRPQPLRRRALSFDEGEEVGIGPVEAEEGPELGVVEGGLGGVCLVEVLRRLPPRGLMAAAAVCKGWRESVRRVWRSAEEMTLRVPSGSQIGFVGSVLQRCTGLARLSLRMESDVDATVLACIAFSCTNLENLEITTADSAVNRITGDDLSRFVAEKRCLSSLKIEGCSSLGFLNLSSSSLSTLWLSELYCISKTILNCPNLRELSLDFSRQENDSTDLAAVVDGLSRTCSRLRNIHIASSHLTHAAVLALAAADLKGLRMLSLVLGLKITDASVAAIVQSYTNLELLDLSGSSITDSGIGMICNVLPDTLSRLLLALCPNITSSGVQFATAQLPLLQLIDCGMSMCDTDMASGKGDAEDADHDKGTSSRPQPIYQKLIIKHGRLRKLSLWGCSGLDALYLNCPDLNDLNLNSCTNLHPERLLLQCPSLENVHASGCNSMLVAAIENQVMNKYTGNEISFPCKRLADGSKRIQVPNFLPNQPADDEKRKKIRRVQCTLQC